MGIIMRQLIGLTRYFVEHLMQMKKALYKRESAHLGETPELFKKTNANTKHCISVI